jgi:hypothetical protein
VPLPHDPGPHWGEVGIHGLHRQREWDVVTTVTAPAPSGDEAWFVVLDGGRIVAEAPKASVELERLAAAITIDPPFRVHAVRRAASLWVVAARRIETVDLVDDPGGDAIELSWDGAERTVRIDGRPTLVGVPRLERLGAARHTTYVVTASRIDGLTWEVAVAPL